MPNGFMGSKAEWDRLEAPLVALDRAFDEFTARHGCALERNYHAWPSRTFRWRRDDGIGCWVAIARGSDADLTFTVDGGALADHAGARLIKRVTVLQLPAPLDAAQTLDALETAHRVIDMLTTEQLERIEIAEASFAAFLRSRSTCWRAPAVAGGCA